MSYQNLSASCFAVASLLALGAVRAQQPSAEVTPAAQSDQQKPQPPEAAPTAGHASPSPHATTDAPQKAASNSAPLAGIVVKSGPSADILRSARDAGFKIKIANGTTHFCKTEAPIGTRFVTESCMNEQQVTLWLSRAQYQREKLQNLLGAPSNTH